MSKKTKQLTREDFVKWGTRGGLKSGIIRKEKRLQKLKVIIPASPNINDAIDEPPSME